LGGYREGMERLWSLLSTIDVSLISTLPSQKKTVVGLVFTTVAIVKFAHVVSVY
jgi:hypothetical protein